MEEFTKEQIGNNEVTASEFLKYKGIRRTPNHRCDNRSYLEIINSGAHKMLERDKA